ncbi:hypothetical protein NUM3379_02210 [Kineococcus sp. NUM-3379]
MDHDDESGPTTRTVEPHHLVVWAARWYLVAFDRLAPWPCTGSAVLELPAALVARFAPGAAARGRP